QRVARFINTLPHYKFLEGHNQQTYSFRKKIAKNVFSMILKMIPFKKKLFETIDIRTDGDLCLNYSCIAFIKLEEDGRKWDWDKVF
ncbi:MAG: hypothetical protein ABIP68_05375, partial [Ferruginibacter sp.]